MSTNAQFDAALPAPYSEKWRKAYQKDDGDSPRMASYQAPGGKAIPFIQKSFRFSGGQAQDTAEYPFGGLWSNEYINEKPQSITVDGFLRGPAYIAGRNKLIEALRVPTNDDNPGYIDLPFWGRFPVVVGDNYEVSESADEQGQCAVSISFTRAGVSVAERTAAQPDADAGMESAAADMEAAAADDFAARLPDDKLDWPTLRAGFGQIKNTLLGILGRIQGAQNVLNAITEEIMGIMNIVNQGIRAHRDLALAPLRAGEAIAGGIMEIKNTVALYGREPGTGFWNNLFGSGESSGNGGSGSGDGSSGSGGSGSAGGSSGQDGSSDGGSGSSGNTPSLPLPENEKNALVLFLSASDFTLSTGAATVSEQATKEAVENLYRILAFLVSARIIANMDSLTRQKAVGYWRLMERLAERINQENPAIYAAIQNLRSALSRELSRRELSAELTRRVSVAVPLLFLAWHLGCDEEKIRELNSVADSFVVEGGVIYV